MPTGTANAAKKAERRVGFAGLSHTGAQLSLIDAKRKAARRWRSRQVQEETKMDSADITALAHHLFSTHGTRAVAEAARKAAAFEKTGDDAQAKAWRRIEAVLLEMRGPRES